MADEGKFATLVLDFYRGKVILIWVYSFTDSFGQLGPVLA